MGYLTILTNVHAIKHITNDIFSGRQRTSALCVQHSPTAAALSTNTTFESKYDFRVSRFTRYCRSTSYLRCHIKAFLIACFISNISAKNYQNLFMCVEVIANHRWDVFWDTV